MIDALVIWYGGVVNQALLLDFDVQKVKFETELRKVYHLPVEVVQLDPME